ncbi:MAG TPA: VIT1/CCC1 family protein [Tepidiformaceae bacterium]|nr:VIT1/CCC1 family protein [Tepidiformaceae bacterium]
MNTDRSADIKRYKANLKDETDGAALYRLLAEAEEDEHLKEVFERLASSEDRHLALWQEKIREAGGNVPVYRPSFKVKLLGWLARRFGTGAVSPIVTRMELAATTMYDNQPEAVAANLPADERSHARLFREINKAPGSGAVDIARTEGRHRGTSGNALRAAVLGANDGLVSNLSLVMGVAGAGPAREVVFLSGIAGWLAGGLSMALGEWISVRSSTEAFERQIQIEREELELMPEEELEELTLIYRAKGLAEDEARTAAARILSNKDQALETLAREEMGMAADESGAAGVAALTSFLTFSVGAILPVIPWLFVAGLAGIVSSAIASGVGLFLTGAIITLYTGRSVLFSGSRMLAFGLAAAAITFTIGRIIGVSTGI